MPDGSDHGTRRRSRGFLATPTPGVQVRALLVGRGGALDARCRGEHHGHGAHRAAGVDESNAHWAWLRGRPDRTLSVGRHRP